MATLSVLQDFWYLRRRTFVNFFVVRGIKTSGGKAGQVTRVSSAAEFKLLIIEWSEEKQAKLKSTMRAT